jgi:hypothetical protein
MTALAYLQNKEWSMGNGQCPECEGVHSGWYGHPLHKTAATIGHKPECLLATGIKELGGTPIFLGGYVSDVVYETRMDNAGFYSTRIKQ